ncbi:hypothetical protein NQ318_006159 [Aromia moschata]|uniref:Uncharacterized protein n=1 Tax=Aromia moschata TaxID=1265417 RepID=A0AAV8XND3_9CUCU|nr:hypothetical protein NQ318_006159 [Aromia moschata]
MHHLYPLAKGDPLCPLGFHPQVRWPTRCKRCFRDYKEHGGKKRDDNTSLRRDAATASTPSLSWNSSDSESKRRSWVSSSNLAGDQVNNNSCDSDYSNPSSWTSTPDLANLQDDTQAVTTVSIKLPKRKQKPLDTGQRTVSDSFSIVKDKSAIFNKGDSLATRAKKLQAIKESSTERGKRIQIKEVKTISEEPTNHDVQFLIQVKAKPEREQDNSDNDDTISLAGTETTDTTLVDPQDSEMRDQLESLRKELEATKSKCERLERDKSDILLRRLAAMETTTKDYKDEKKSLKFRVRELEEDLELRPTAQQAQKVADELRSKLLAAETLCEELMDENEDIKKELRDMEEQMDELQDNFREDQAVEYTSLKKDLDQTTKNCRILSFKLRKAERKTSQLEFEKGSGTTLNQMEKIKQLQQELKIANEVSLRLQKELEEAKQKLSKKKVSRESLTRGGSQDDPAQLLRDLQDSLEREADLREQLKFAEEEAQTLRKKVSRIEDDNESLVLQLKKMATRARSTFITQNVLEGETNDLRKKLIEKERDCERLHAELSLVQKRSKGMQKASQSLDLDQQTLDLKRQLQVMEQEAAVLRNKVQALESENEKLTAENKRLNLLRGTKNLKSEKNLDKYIDQIATLEVELAERDQKIRELEDALNAGLKEKAVELAVRRLSKIQSKSSKKVTSLTSRDQLKTMVSDLEKEIEEVRKMKAAQEFENAMKDLELLNKKYDSIKKELDEEKSKNSRENKTNDDLKKNLRKTKENLELAKEENEKLQDKIDKLTKEQQKLNEEKKNMNEEINKLKVNLKSAAATTQDEITLLTQKNASLKLSLEEKNKESQKMKSELEDKAKIASENAGKDKKILDLESQLIKFENKYSETDKKLREQNKDFETKIEKEKQKIKELETDQTKWEDDRKKLNQKIDNLNTKIKGLENTIEQKNKLVKQLEDSLTKEREIVSKTNLKAGETANREISKLKDELSKNKVNLSELESKLEIATKNQRDLQDRLKKTEQDNKNSKLDLERKNKEIEIDLQNERKKIEPPLRQKIKKLELSAGGGIKKELEIKQFQEAIEKLEATIARERQKYDDLTAKYEILEEEHVVTKAKLVMEKETLERLNNTERARKSDLAELKMRYESQINVINSELQSLHNQVVRFKREKDTYKHMLESAQKTIGELKSQSPKTSRKGSLNINYDEMEEAKNKIATLEQQISCMEDELSEARLECSRLKTELVSERSTYEVKLSEFHSRVNELEEEKVLNSGRTKIVGLRTKMELAWQKEREEQQRLLQETATLARDLRQTLFEVERERDKERLEAKRKQDLFKKTSEEEQDENKRKITELQCDLLELRDAHAKLRTTNEKLRREKERYEKEREEYRSAINGKKRLDQEDDRKINALVEQVDTLKQLAPELFFSRDNEAPYTPTPPRRTKSKSRESSPAVDRRESSLAPEEKQQQIQYIMQRLVHTTEDLRRLQRLSEDEFERERIRRSMGGNETGHIH